MATKKRSTKAREPEPETEPEEEFDDEVDEEQESDESVGDDLPPGFAPGNAEGGAPFVKPEKGLIVQGILLGRYPRSGNANQYIYQIRVVKPTTCVVGSGEDKQQKVVNPGGIVNLDERSAISNMKDLLELNHWCEVFIKFRGKQRTKDGSKTFWDCRWGKKRATPDTLESVGMATKAEDHETDDQIPF